VTAIAGLGAVASIFAAARAKMLVLQMAMTMRVLALFQRFFGNIAKSIFSLFR
jgi:hypothetical protein